jgi:nucleoside 2-deoxyribosyltransferase
MRVFVSSVRRGLEAERDAVPGLILALGHEPVTFEDFTALDLPSREACLRAVASADAYLLMLGQFYGDPLPDTGASPTEEESNAARARGIPVLAFRKRGVAMEPAQAEFVGRVEDYVSGRFRASFDGVKNLMVAVGNSLRGLATGQIRSYGHAYPSRSR